MKSSFNSRPGGGEGSTAYKLWGLPQVLCEQLLPLELTVTVERRGVQKFLA